MSVLILTSRLNTCVASLASCIQIAPFSLPHLLQVRIPPSTFKLFQVLLAVVLHPNLCVLLLPLLQARWRSWQAPQSGSMGCSRSRKRRARMTLRPLLTYYCWIYHLDPSPSLPGMSVAALAAWCSAAEEPTRLSGGCLGCSALVGCARCQL